MWTEADKHYFKINDLNINNHFICKYRDPLKNYILQRLKEFQKFRHNKNSENTKAI